METDSDNTNIGERNSDAKRRKGKKGAKRGRSDRRQLIGIGGEKRRQTVRGIVVEWQKVARH